MRTLAFFTAGSLLVGLAALAGGWAAWGFDALVQGGAAFGLAFVPAALTMALVLIGFRSSPEMQLLAGLGGSGVRMAVALGGGCLLTAAVPERFDLPFWAWLVVFYLSLLAFEITLLVRNQPKPIRQTSLPQNH